MLISKRQGEKLSVKKLKQVYGGCSCGGQCGLCDCTSSNGDQFYSAFDPEMTSYDRTLCTPATGG